MLLPILFIKEGVYAKQYISKQNSFEAIKTAFSNRNFFIFTISDLTYWFALTFIQNGISYYVILLLKLPKEAATLLMTVSFIVSFLLYFPTPIIARRTGKKRLLIVAFALFAVVFALIGLMGFLPFSPLAQGFGILILAAIPLALFGILPNAIVADIADADSVETGNHKAAVFFGACTFMSKIGASLTLLIFPVLIRIGNRETNQSTAIGARITALVAFVFVIYL